MSISAILEIAIGLILIYYVLGLMVSAVTSWITRGFEIRAKELEKYLAGILKDEDKLSEILQNPLVTVLKPIGLVPILGFFTGKIAEYKAGKIPGATFAQSLFGQAIDADMTLEQIKATVSAATESLPPESQLKNDLDNLVAKAETSLTEAEAKAAQLRSDIESWFDQMMVKAGATFTAQARRIVIALAFVVTLFTGVDSIDIAQQLWNQPNLRAIAAAKAVEIAGGEELDEDIKALVTTLKDLEFDYHNDWWNTRNTNEAPNAILLKVLGLAITWIAVAQGSSFWYDLMKKVTSITKSTVSTAGSQPANG